MGRSSGLRLYQKSQVKMLYFISTIFLVLLSFYIFDFEKFKSLGKSFYSAYGRMTIWGTLRQ